MNFTSCFPFASMSTESESTPLWMSPEYVHLPFPQQSSVPVYSGGAGRQQQGGDGERGGGRKSREVQEAAWQHFPQTSLPLTFMASHCPPLRRMDPVWEHIPVSPNLCPSHFQYMIYSPFQSKSGQVMIVNMAAGEMFKNMPTCLNASVLSFVLSLAIPHG